MSKDLDKRREDRKNRMRERIQEQIDRANEDQKRDLFRKRLETARAGLKAFELKQYKEAVKSFHFYFKILEDWKKVNPGQLRPNQFDQKKDVPELLLITSIYWDLVKLYDSSKKADRTGQFKHYLEKFVLFSKGMPYQRLMGEALRKYMKYREGSPNKAAIKEAYKVLVGGSKCFVVTSLADHVEGETLETLRAYRDQVLLKNHSGRALVAVYYQVGPTLAKCMDYCPEGFRRWTALRVDSVARKVSSKVLLENGSDSSWAERNIKV